MQLFSGRIDQQWTCICLLCSHITREELEQALIEKGMYDETEIKGIIDDVDVDNVSRKSSWNNLKKKKKKQLFEEKK